MNARAARFVRQLMLALTLAVAVAPPAAAEETQLLRDAETEQLFKDLSKPLIEGAGLDPNSTSVVLLGDPEINAFVERGQVVYLQSGLVQAADNVNELQGVIAHELGHVAGGHAIRYQQGVNQATGLSIATMVLGAIALAAGAGNAALGIMAAGQQVATTKFLSFTRTQESSADQAAVKYLASAGISGKGMLQFFSKLQNQEYRLAVYAKDSYDRTHPLSSERVAALEQNFKKDAAWAKPADPALQARFERVKAKLLGFVNPKQAVIKFPESDQTVPGHYARAYAYHVGSYPDKALAETNALLALSPQDPYFLELKGQILLESGKPAEAIAPLREATKLSKDTPLIAAMLGHALVATEDAKNFAEAKQVLKAAVSRDNQNPFAWYQLGIIYGHEGDQPRAALASAERYSLEGNQIMAMTSARQAVRGIRPGTPDCLRAVDILMSTQAELKTKKKGNDDTVVVRAPKGSIELRPGDTQCRGT